MERIAFVILAWNSEAYLDDCLKSVLGIGNLCAEVWVVDNGSSDRTPEILSSFKDMDSRVHVLTLRENVGTTVSRNMAIKSVSKEIPYICILDSDTVVNADAFHLMVKTLETDSSIGVIGPTLLSPSGEEQFSGRELPTAGIKLRKACPIPAVQNKGSELEQPHTPIVNGLQDVGYLISACWLVPRKTFDAVGLLDENIFYAPEDVDFCLRVWKSGMRVVRCYNARIIHVYQRLSHKKLFSKTNAKHVKGLIYYFIKYRYLWSSPSITAFVSKKDLTKDIANSKCATNQKVLVYTEAWGVGGIESFLMNVFRHLSGNGFAFDLFSTWDWNDTVDEELEKLGVHRTAMFRGHRPGQLTRLCNGLKGFSDMLSKKRYDAVYINTMNGLGFLYAREATRHGVPVRVVHSHNSDVGEGEKSIKRIIGHIGSYLFGRYATSRAACSKAAGEYLFGNRDFSVVKNGVDTRRFCFDPAARARVRSELGIGTGTHLVGNIGRIAPAKNPLFQLEVFAELLKLDPTAHYLMVGGNEMGNDVFEKAKSLGIQGKITVLPQVANPAPYYSALDAFLMPSLFEGLPFVLVEAQTSGLPICCSDCLPPEGDVTDLVHHCSLSTSPTRWATELVTMMDSNMSDRCSYSQVVSDAGWSTAGSADAVKYLFIASQHSSSAQERKGCQQNA